MIHDDRLHEGDDTVLMKDNFSKFPSLPAFSRNYGLWSSEHDSKRRQKVAEYKPEK